MTKRSTFRQSDLMRALKAAIAAGLRVTQFEIKPDGSISVLTSTSSGEIVSTPLEQWMSSRARTS
jgi:hypothetical protein